MKTKSILKMLSSRYNQLSIFVLLIIMGTVSVKASEITREYTDSKNVTVTDKINIKTSHCGNMIINTSDKNTVSFKISVNIDVSEKDKDAANEILNEINYKIEKSGNGVLMDIDWPFRNFSQSDGLLSGGVTKITMKSGKKFELEGKVKVKITAELDIPKANQLSLEGTHSTIELGHLANTADIRAGHSTLNANDIKGLKLSASHSTVEIGNVTTPSEIELSHSKLQGLKLSTSKVVCSHSDLSAIETADLTITLAHSDVNIDRTGNLTIPSVQHSNVDINVVKNIDISSTQHSYIDIENAENVEVKDGQHGKITIKNLKSFDFNSGSFTQLHLGTVSNALHIDTQHSNIIVEDLLSSVKTINIEDQFASVTVGTEKIPNIDLMVNGGDHSTVNVNNTLEKKSDGYYKKRKDSGNILEIQLKCEHCTINVK